MSNSSPRRKLRVVSQMDNSFPTKFKSNVRMVHSLDQSDIDDNFFKSKKVRPTANYHKNEDILETLMNEDSITRKA